MTSKQYSLNDEAACSSGGDDNSGWGTSIAIASICTAASIILFLSPQGCTKVVPFYFLATGISYISLGIRQIFGAKLNLLLQESLEKTSQVFNGLGSILLLVLSMLMVKLHPRSESIGKIVTFWCLTGFISGLLLVTIFFEAKIGSGVPLDASISFGLLIVLLSVYISQMYLDRSKLWHYIAKALAVFIIAIEALYSTIIASVECSPDCSKSSCQNSNGGNNAVVHDVVLFFGFSILAWGEDTCPSVTAYEVAQHSLEGVVEEDETEVADTSGSDWATSDGQNTDLESSNTCMEDRDGGYVYEGEEEEPDEEDEEKENEDLAEEQERVKGDIGSDNSEVDDSADDRDSKGDDTEVHNV